MVSSSLLHAMLKAPLSAGGTSQQHVQPIEKQFISYAYWISLAAVSPVGLGTGLHTFLLYLGPQLASITLATYECKAVEY